jgi:hypothetical protein
MRDLLLKVLPPLVVIFLSVISFQSGVTVPGNLALTDAPIGIQVLYSCTLFTLGGTSLGYPNGGPDFWRSVLYVMYFAAPLISAAALMELFYILSRPIVSMNLFNRETYLVLGYGRVGRAAIESVRKNVQSRNGFTDSKGFKWAARYFLLSWIYQIFKPRFIVFDMNVRQTTASVSFNGSDVHFVRHDLRDTKFIDDLSFGRIKGVFILTDDEWINLGILKALEKKLCKTTKQAINQNDDHIFFHKNAEWDSSIEYVFTRMHSRDFMMAMSHEYECRESKPKIHFFNTQMEAASQLFDTDNPNECLLNEFSDFHKWGQGRDIHTWIFFGFGRFSSTFCEKLLEDEMFNNEVKEIIIIDQNASHEYKLFKIEHGDFWRITKNEKGFNILSDKATIIDRPMEKLSDYEMQISDQLQMDILSHQAASALVVFGSNNDSANFNTAIAFKKFLKTRLSEHCKFHFIVRCRDKDSYAPNLMQQIVAHSKGKSGIDVPLIVIPTYSWVGAYFEDRFNDMDLGLKATVITSSSVVLSWQRKINKDNALEVPILNYKIHEFHEQSHSGFIKEIGHQEKHELLGLVPETLYQWQVGFRPTPNTPDGAIKWSAPSFFLTKVSATSKNNVVK